MMMKPSRKHHYLPRHYLRGFTDPDGTFFVYDKRTGKTFPSSPDATFFEKDLNTVTLPDGTPSDFLEKVYTAMESRAWPSLGNIRNSTLDAPISLWDKMELFFFLSFLHWRLPSNAATAERLSQRFFGSDEELRFFKLKRTNGTEVSQEDIDQVRASSAWQKAARGVIPFAPFFKGDSWAEDLANWRFLYTADGASSFVVGDNPIVTHGCNDHDPVTCLREFIFPVSGRILLISRGKDVANPLPADFMRQYGTAIIERSRRFVACRDRSLLEALLSDHELHVRFDKTDHIIQGLFEMLRGTKEEH